VANKELQYTIVNQAYAGSEPNNNYNCSGMIEDVLSKNTSLQFGDVSLSLPVRVAEIVIQNNSVFILKHDAEALQLALPALVEDVQRSRL
jgi:hypothetical protein